MMLRCFVSPAFSLNDFNSVSKQSGLVLLVVIQAQMFEGLYSQMGCSYEAPREQVHLICWTGGYYALTTRSYSSSPSCSFTKQIVPLNSPSFKGRQDSSQVEVASLFAINEGSPQRSSPIIATSYLHSDLLLFEISILWVVTCLTSDLSYIVPELWGSLVTTVTVYHRYCYPFSYVRMMLPVYYPQSIGFTVKGILSLPPDGKEKVEGTVQFIRSVQTLKVMDLSW